MCTVCWYFCKYMYIHSIKQKLFTIYVQKWQKWNSIKLFTTIYSRVNTQEVVVKRSWDTIVLDFLNLLLKMSIFMSLIFHHAQLVFCKFYYLWLFLGVWGGLNMNINYNKVSTYALEELMVSYALIAVFERELIKSCVMVDMKFDSS